MNASNESAVLDAAGIARKLRPVMDGHPEILCAYLFGSRARGTAGPASDTDIAVFRTLGVREPDRPWQTYWGDLHAELAGALGQPAGKVDLVLLDEVRDPLLRHRATWMGRSVYCRDEAARTALEARILIEFMDTERLRAIQFDAVKRAVGIRRGH